MREIYLIFTNEEWYYLCNKNYLGAAVQTKRFAGADLVGNKYFHILDEGNQWKRIVCFEFLFPRYY
jgi:hypothetical protein